MNKKVIYKCVAALMLFVILFQTCINSVCRLKENQLKTIDFTVFSAQRWYNKVHGFNRS